MFLFLNKEKGPWPKEYLAPERTFFYFYFYDFILNGIIDEILFRIINCQGKVLNMIVDLNSL